jgi:YVTN family beta-propeller protein
LPTFEACNGEDDDCDGVPDEGALSPCGGCNPECTGGVWGSIADPFFATGDLTLTPVGELTLPFTPRESETVWVANTGDGTVSKIDAVRAEEIARYQVGGAPERVAVDHNGDAWILAPSFDARSTLTKLAGDRSACVDRDGDGVRTSGARDEVLAAGTDECVLLTQEVGEPGEVARSLAIDGARTPDGLLGGDVWVGMERGARVVEFDGTTGELLGAVGMPGIAPYAAVFDPWGVLWVLDREGKLARVDPGARPAAVDVIEVPLSCFALESLASDRAGVLTLAGASCERVSLYDPARDRWDDVKTESVLTPHAVVALDDASWVVHLSGELSRVSRAPLAIEETYSLADDARTPIESTAIGADALGRLWVVSARGGPQGAGVVTRFDPEDEDVGAQVVVGRRPRGQGDITGSQRLGEFAPEGIATHVFDGCGPLDRGSDPERVGPPSEWRRLHVASTIGQGASVTVEARRAARRGTLGDTPFVVLGELPEDESPFEVSFEPGGVVEVRLTLRVAGRLGAPRVARVGLEWRCPGPL